MARDHGRKRHGKTEAVQGQFGVLVKCVLCEECARVCVCVCVCYVRACLLTCIRMCVYVFLRVNVTERVCKYELVHEHVSIWRVSGNVSVS